MKGRIPDGPLVTFGDIAEALRQVQVSRGAVVYVHSSLSSMGYVQGGADTVIDAFLNAVGPEGTLCVPTIVYAGRGPRPPFDVAHTPSEVGRITETLRLRPEARRSDNPTHSVAAIGPQADEITAGHGGGAGRPAPMGRACLRPREPLAALLRPGRDLRAAGGRLGSQHDVPLHPVALHRAVLERVRLGAAVPVLRPHADGPGAGSGRHRPDLRTGLGDGDRRELAAHGGSKRCGAASGSGPVLRGRRAQRLRPLVSEHPLPPATPAGGRGAAADHSAARTGRRPPRCWSRCTSAPLALRFEEHTAAIVVCDLRGLDRPTVTAARRLVEERTGIPAGHVMIACTHNHAGPDTDIPAGAAERLRLHVIERIAEAVDAAHGRMREARTGTACATLDGIARNRRLLCGDGTVVTLRRSVPSSWLPLRGVQFEAGPIDRDLTVLRIEDLDGEPIALLSSVGLPQRHPAVPIRRSGSPATSSVTPC